GASAAAHSRPQSTGRAPPPGIRRAGGAVVQVAVQPLPGVPFAAPASHSSLHSTAPFPQLSTRQLAEQPSHSAVPPSSHCSKSSVVPFPQTAGFGLQTSATSLLFIRTPFTSRLEIRMLRLPALLALRGTRIEKVS